MESGVVFQSIETPIRIEPDYDKRINGPDQGLINAWMVGRELAGRCADLVERARNGELPPLDYKGGVAERIKGNKIGVLHYLAKWQGLRGDDLNIDLIREVEMVCSRTGVKVLFTPDFDKLKNA